MRDKYQNRVQKKQTNKKARSQVKMDCDMKEVEPGSLVGKCEGDLMVYGDNGRNTIRCWRHVRMVEIWIRSCLVNELVLWEFLKAVNDEKLEEQMNLISELRNWVKAK